MPPDQGFDQLGGAVALPGGIGGERQGDEIGQGFAIQPAHFYKGSQLAPGYSYQYCGGDSQYSNIPIETLLTDNLLPYNSDTYFYGSLAEPMSCIIGTFHAM